MIYPIVIHKEKKSDYGVTVPDLPGCFSAGSTLDEAMAMVREAIELHLEGLIEEGQIVPKPGSLDSHENDPQFRGGTWALVSIDPRVLRINAKRVNVTIPQRILDALDRAAAKEHDSRSGLLTKAATEYLERGAGKLLKNPAKKWTRRNPRPSH